MIYTVIIKPTKECNADCSYCSAPPETNANNRWSIETFKTIFDNIEPKLGIGCDLIWHGGEPMLMGPDFYRDAHNYVIEKGRDDIEFGIQTNILLYKSSQWKNVFHDVFKGRISSSFDPDEQMRTVKGDSEKYSKQFYRKINEMVSDGFYPLVIGTYTEKTSEMVFKMYEYSRSFGDDAFDLRYNYRYPAGRVQDSGSFITPDRYGKMLIELWDRWIEDCPPFDITPLNQMATNVIKSQLGSSGSQRCPWTKDCGGRFLGIEPNGDVYNCSEFADLAKQEYCYGNAIKGTVPSPGRNIVNFYERPPKGQVIDRMLSTDAARKMRSRAYNLPQSCLECRHFKQCQGGCMRDAELYDRGLGGKFYYCLSWKMVFDRIKSSIINGEADSLLISRGIDPDNARNNIRDEALTFGTDILEYYESFNIHEAY